jgi:thiosulfate/3-mercaptopyruvate sulfurtransferase
MFMDEVGLEPVLYLGGYSDWISYEENEIVREAEGEN